MKEPLWFRCIGPIVVAIGLTLVVLIWVFAIVLLRSISNG